MAKKLKITEKDSITFANNPPSIAEEIAVRKRSIDFYTLGMYLPNPDHVLKKQGKDITIYNELLSDAHVGACEDSRKSGVKSLEWEIDRGKAKSRQAKLIEDCFNGLNLEHIMGEILNAPLFGYQVLEVVWEKVGNYILPKDVVGKPQEWFVFSEENELRFRTKDNYNGEPLPERKFLLARHKPTYKNPYGFPVLSRCFWPVTFKRGGLKFWVIFTEKYGMPFLVGKHPRGTTKEETDKLADMLEAMIQDAIAVIPDDASVEIQEAGGKGSSAQIYRDLIDTCNSEISKAILGQTLTTQQSDVGSYALGTVHFEVRKDIIDSDKKLVQQTMNQLIQWIYELNFSAGDRPVFSLYEEEEVDKALAERDEILSRQGVKFSKEYYQREYGFEDGDIEVDPQPSITQFAESDISSDQRDIENLIDNILSETSINLTPLHEIIDSAESYEDLQKKIKNAYGKINLKEFREILERALFLAELKGRSLNA